MRRMMLIMMLVLLATLSFTPAATAEPTGCLGPDPHQRPDCKPDVSDPTCITWYFWLGEARICPLE